MISICKLQMQMFRQHENVISIKFDRIDLFDVFTFAQITHSFVYSFANSRPRHAKRIRTEILSIYNYTPCNIMSLATQSPLLLLFSVIYCRRIVNFPLYLLDFFFCDFFLLLFQFVSIIGFSFIRVVIYTNNMYIYIDERCVVYLDVASAQLSAQLVSSNVKMARTNFRLLTNRINRK